MLGAPSPGSQQAFGPQPAPERLAGHAQVLLGQILAGQHGTKARVLLAIRRQSLFPQRRPRAMVPQPTAALMHQARISFPRYADRPPRLAMRKPANHPGLADRDLPAFDLAEGLQPMSFPYVHM